ncbi:MAG TPA: hypothetical protein VMR41_02230 [Patescibacteria group bacterium]|nr:hypothetical protein [Patescibacteria group bacterium]
MVIEHRERIEMVSDTSYYFLGDSPEIAELLRSAVDVFKGGKQKNFESTTEKIRHLDTNSSNGAKRVIIIDDTLNPDISGLSSEQAPVDTKFIEELREAGKPDGVVILSGWGQVRLNNLNTALSPFGVSVLDTATPIEQVMKICDDAIIAGQVNIDQRMQKQT